ncbi:MAG: AI-2E family transporter [Clostridiales bacterium]|nr:AI-2E family transporter [Clostridiales bacterium]
MKIRFESKYIKTGVTAVLSAIVIILFFFAILRMDGIIKALGIMTGILTPFIYGLVMAYLLCPAYNLAVRRCSKVKWPRIRGKDRTITISKGIASVFTVLIILGIVFGFLWMIIPQLIESIVNIAKTLPSSIERLLEWIQVKFDQIPQITGPMEQWLGDVTTRFTAWVEEILIPEYESVLTGISDGLFGVLNVIKNFFIGIVICVFFINRKEVFAAQSKKLVLAVLKEESADMFLKGSAFTNKTFSGFITGKIIDSAIIGVICFIFMSIFGWPYSALISIIIGVTNIIPFFGPFIGAIPSALLLLMEDPKICLYFVIFILILQQVDGNIIGPKILGDSTGLPSFWVLFAILVGGGLFGFVGMVVGIPIFAVIYAYICFAVNKRLEKKGMSTDLRDYKYLYKYKNYKPGEEYSDD